MSHFNDNYDGADESEQTDAVVRELRAEIIRLEAQLDQLRAGVRERVAESAQIQTQLVELAGRFVRLEARRKRDEKLLVLAWFMVVVSIALSLFSYLTL